MPDGEQSLAISEQESVGPKIPYDPEDNSSYDEYPSRKFERVDFATSSEGFKTKRSEFIDSRIEHYEEQISSAIDEFRRNSKITIETPSPETKRNAARLLANMELGVKLVYNRYDPESTTQHKGILFSATSDGFSEESLFTYLDKPIDKIGVQIQRLLKVSENPEKWYEESKASGWVIGPINEDSVWDLMLFAGIEEASHALFISNTPDLQWEEPQHDEFYYAANQEFQALKVMSFFANKYFPEYSSQMKEKLSQAVQHRKGKSS